MEVTEKRFESDIEAALLSRWRLHQGHGYI